MAEANLDLAQALAQQASGARGRRGKGMAGATSGPAAPARWQPLKLDKAFRVSSATQRALVNVANTMNRTLRPEGLVVNVPNPMSGPAENSGENDVAATAQGAVETPVLVAEARGGKVVRAYDEAEFLTVFARQRQLNGVIVDGQA